MANTIEFNVDSNAVTVLNQTTVAAEKTAKGFTSAKAELRALQQQLLTMDQSSAEFKKASARAAELKDNISDLSAEINANAGNAFEGLSNNVGLFGSRLMSLDLKGAGQALTNMGGAVKNINFATVKEELGGMIKGVWNLAKALLANPIFLLVGVIAAIAMNWDALVKLWNTSDIDKLKQAQAALEGQNKAINEQIALEKARGKYGEETYYRQTQILRNEIEIFKLKQKQMELEGESEEAQKANEERQKKVLDLKKLQVEADGKIYQAVENAKGALDPVIALQQKKTDAAKEELGALELIKQRQQDQSADIQTMTDEMGKYQALLGKEKTLRDKLQGLVERGIMTRGQAMQMEAQAGNSQNKSKQIQQDINKLIQDKIAGIDGEIKGIGLANGGYAEQMRILQEAANKKMDAVKSEEQIAAEKETERKKEEAAAESKRKRDQRAADAESKRKEIQQQTLEIHKQIDEYNRRNLSDKDKELFLLDEKYKKERKILEQSAEGKKLLLQYDEQYLISKQEIEAKYEKIANEKRIAQADAEFALLQELETDQQTKEVNALIASYEAKFLVVKDNADLEKQLIEQFEIDKNAIVKKYRDKQNEENAIAAAKELEELAKSEAEISAAKQAAQDFRLKQLGDSFAALGALNDAFTKKGQQQSKKQFQIQKALNLASAVVDTYGGINKALNDKTMPSTTARIIQASIVGAMGLANVIKISKTEYGNASAPSGTSPSAGGGGDAGTTAPSPANFAFLQNQPNQQPPLQAYVVGTQVSSNLEAQQLIQNQSRLGG
jgi:hypothetical protein